MGDDRSREGSRVRRGSSARRGRIWDDEEALAVSLALQNFGAAAQAPDDPPQPRASLFAGSSSSRISAGPLVQLSLSPLNSADPQIQPSSRRNAQALKGLLRAVPSVFSSSSRTSFEPRGQPRTQVQAKAPKVVRQLRASTASSSSVSVKSLVQPPTRKGTQSGYEIPQLRTSTPSSGSNFRVTAEPEIRSPARKKTLHKRASNLFFGLAARLSRATAAPIPQDVEVSALNVRALRSKQPLQLRDDLLQILVTPRLKAQALGLRHSEAARFNELIHRCLTALPENEPAQVPMLRLLQDVCSESGELPSSYWLKRVTVNWRKCIGKGGEALIFPGSFQDQKVVARQIHKPDSRGWGTESGQEALKYIRREIITHAQLRHPNVIPFLGVFRDDDNEGAPMIILPFMEKGSAMDYLNQNQLSATRLHLRVRSTLLGVTNALEYLHGKNPPIYHGDVHPGNILINAEGNAVICDFGFSRIRHEITRTHTLIREGGRLRYLAPELSSGPYKFRTSRASDIYSLAMTFLTFLTLALPFAEIKREFEAVRTAEQGIRPQRPPKINLSFGEEAPMWELLGYMWRHQPEKRLDASSVNDYLKAIFSYSMIRGHEGRQARELGLPL